MSTVKITDLPYITSLQSNTANTVLVGVDVPGDYTGQMTLTTLAKGLYSHNYLVVGDYETVYPNAIATFAGGSNNYVQTIIENTKDAGSSDFVAQANVSSDTAYYIDVGFTGNTYNNLSPYNSLGTSVNQLDGYLYVQGLEGSKGGNLVIGTASSNTRVNFIVGGVNSQNIVAYMTTAGIYSPSINSLVAANVASINGSITANVASINGSITSNVSTINGSITANVATINASITANAASANSVINSRITANIATVLANTNGVTTAGALNVPGNLLATGNLIIANATYDYTNTALVRLVGSTGGVFSTPTTPGYMLAITGIDGIPSRVVNTGHGTGAYGLFAGRSSRGTAGSPTAVQSGDVIARFSGGGHNGSTFTATGQGRIDIVADENFTTANNGSRIEFWNTIPKTNTVTKIATFNANTVTFTGVVAPQKGFAYTPNNITSNATSYTIDFSRDSMTRMSCNDNMSITLSNYQSGKIVEVWITNNANQNKTVTHGCLANNSTAKATSFTIQANACAFLKYFSIDGDQANTFVTITA